MERGRETRPISPTEREPRNPVVVGMGANLGDVALTFRTALLALQERSRVARVSALYRSAPIGPEQPDFLNAAVLLDYAGGLAELLVVLHEIEARAGRIRAERWGPRSLDLDILWAGSQEISSSSLTVPHDQLDRRAFALVPLLDVQPDARQPENGVLYAAILRGLEEQRCTRVEGDNWWEAVSAL